VTSRDLETRLIGLIDLVGATVAGNEAAVRTALRVYQDTWLRRSPDSEVAAVRRGRRKGWIDKVLEPLPPTAPDKLQRLRAVLALAVGPDPVVMLSDVLGLSPDEATSLLRWAGVALLRAGLADAGFSRVVHAESGSLRSSVSGNSSEASSRAETKAKAARLETGEPARRRLVGIDRKRIVAAAAGMGDMVDAPPSERPTIGRRRRR
jgi:hypothetical protein